MTDAAGPLRGIRILDACDALAVYATKLLLNLGAEVVRLEPPGGDPMRDYPPLVEGVSLYFEHFNAGKRSVTFDPSTTAGLDWLGRLVATCNAVVESGNVADLLSTRLGEASPDTSESGNGVDVPTTRTGSAGAAAAANTSPDADRPAGANAGLGWLRRFRPDLVLVSITPFGLSGPRRDHAGTDLTVAAASGLLALNGRPDATPFRPGGEQAAHMAGLVAANAALLGIFAQQRTGQGCYVEVPASFAATLATLQTANANYYTWLGRLPRRRGAGLMPAFRSLFPARDGWVILIVLPGQWDNLVRLLTAHAAVADLAAPEYQDADHRVREGVHINEVVGAFTARYGKQYISEAAQNAGVACVPVNDTADLVADPFLRQRGFFRRVEQSRLGRPIEYPGPPFHFAERELGTWSPAPELGQDNEALWRQELGMPAATFAELCRTETV